MQKIMILGTFHFQTAGNRDKFQGRTDILSEQRQQELCQMIDALEKFQPTKIAVERQPSTSEEFTQNYQAYLRGEAELAVSETQQLGFRLAKRLGHDKLHCVDWNEAVPGVGSVFQWMSEHPSPQVEAIDRRSQERADQEQEHLENSTLLEHFIYINRPELNAADHRNYLDMARLDDGPWPVGAGWVIQYWYYRNLRIWKNTMELFQSPDEKVLLLIGGGHLHLLTQFFRDAGQIELVNAAEFLQNAVHSEK